MIKGHVDIPEFSFGELDDLQVCLIFPFECLWEWKRKMMNKQLGKNSGFNYLYIHIFSYQHMMHCMPNIPFGQQFIFTFYILFIYLFLISIFYHKQTIDWYKFLKYEWRMRNPSKNMKDDLNPKKKKEGEYTEQDLQDSYTNQRWNKNMSKVSKQCTTQGGKNSFTKEAICLASFFANQSAIWLAKFGD